MGESARANRGAGRPPPRSRESSSFTRRGAGRGAGGSGRGRTAAAHAPRALPPRSLGRAAAPPCLAPPREGSRFPPAPRALGGGDWDAASAAGGGEEGRAVVVAGPSRSERGHVHRAPGEGERRRRGSGDPRDPGAPLRSPLRAPGWAARRALGFAPVRSNSRRPSSLWPQPPPSHSLQPPGVLESAP